MHQKVPNWVLRQPTVGWIELEVGGVWVTHCRFSSWACGWEGCGLDKRLEVGGGRGASNSLWVKRKGLEVGWLAVNRIWLRLKVGEMWVTTNPLWVKLGLEVGGP